VIRLVAFDLDGTVLNHSNEPSETSLAVIRDLLDRGFCAASISGRNFDRNQIPFNADSRLADALYVGGYNGAVVFAPRLNGTRPLMHERRLPLEIFHELIRYADDRKMNFVYCQCDLDAEGIQEVYITDRETEMGRAVAALTEMTYDEDPQLVQRILEGELQTPPKIMLLPEPDDLNVTLRDLDQMFGDRIYKAWAVSGRIEIMHAEVNKGLALRAIAEHAGLDLSEVMAVGDGNNDLPMLRAAGRGVLMANADAATLADVNETDICITGHVEDEGFAEAIRKYVLDV